MEEDRWKNIEVWKKSDDLAFQVFKLYEAVKVSG